jgi:hypothetical protein
MKKKNYNHLIKISDPLTGIHVTQCDDVVGKQYIKEDFKKVSCPLCIMTPMVRKIEEQLENDSRGD